MTRKLTLTERLTGRVDLPVTPAPTPPTPPATINPALPYIPWTLDLWFASDAHVQFAHDLLASPLYRDLLAVLNNSRPHGYDEVCDSRALGRREGYDLLMGTLLQLGNKPPVTAPQPEPTYGSQDFTIDRNV